MWSERPTGTSYRCCSHVDAAELHVLERRRIRGRAVHQREAARRRPQTADTVRSISSGVDMPVEMIIGLPLRAMCRCSGRLVSSPEPVLNTGTPSVSRKSAASRENGVDRKRMPLRAARSRSVVVRLLRERRARQQIEQRLADVRGRRAVAQHLVLGKVRLKLDRIGAGLRGGLDQLGGQRRVAVVVDARFRDDEAGAPGADLARADRQMCRGSRLGLTFTGS